MVHTTSASWPSVYCPPILAMVSGGEEGSEVLGKEGEMAMVEYRLGSNDVRSYGVGAADVELLPAMRDQWEPRSEDSHTSL